MASTSMSLGPHWEKFIKAQVKSGRYSNSSEVMREALRRWEAEEEQIENLRKLIEEGENSGYIENWDYQEFKARMHKRYKLQLNEDGEAYSDET